MGIFLAFGMVLWIIFLSLLKLHYNEVDQHDSKIIESNDILDSLGDGPLYSCDCCGQVYGQYALTSITNWRYTGFYCDDCKHSVNNYRN